MTDKLLCTLSKYDTFTEGKIYTIHESRIDGEPYIINNYNNYYYKTDFYKFPTILTIGGTEFQEVLPIEPQPMTHNTPNHYNLPIEPIDYINALNLDFNLGNVIKYVSRAGKKMGESQFSDLLKARDYINFELERISKDE